MKKLSLIMMGGLSLSLLSGLSFAESSIITEPSAVAEPSMAQVNSLCKKVLADSNYCTNNWEAVKKYPAYMQICMRSTGGKTKAECQSASKTLSCSMVNHDCKSIYGAIESIGNR
jgi:glycine cleavage system pyridoxal-binding protein P